MGRLTECPPLWSHPPQISASDDTARVRLTSSLIGWNQFLQEPPMINVRVLRSHSFLLAAAAEEALQGSWTSSPMCVCVCEREGEEAEYVCVCVRERRGEQSGRMWVTTAAVAAVWGPANFISIFNSFCWFFLFFIFLLFIFGLFVFEQFYFL